MRAISLLGRRGIPFRVRARVPHLGDDGRGEPPHVVRHRARADRQQQHHRQRDVQHLAHGGDTSLELVEHHVEAEHPDQLAIAVVDGRRGAQVSRAVEWPSPVTQLTGLLCSLPLSRKSFSRHGPPRAGASEIPA
jgi:hypothetical protein